MRKILKIDAVNRIKAEKANEFDNSIFSEVYQQTAEMVTQIIALNEKYESWEEHGLDRFINENQISNVISFLGERGMGKSSVMLSFAYYLKTFYLTQELVDKKYMVTSNTDKRFQVLPKIDAAMIGTGENLLDIVLAKMWDDYTVRMEGQGVCKHLKDNIRNEFSDVKSLYSEYQNFSKNATKLEKNADLSELHTLSRSLNLRKKFAELVACYLESFKEISRDNYLVICIDDLDIVKDGTYDILEQIRMFLTIPKVIIMVTADIERLTLDIGSIFSEKLLSSHNKKEEYIDMVHTYAGDYLSKILPINMRIYMPFFNAVYAEVSVHQEELYSLIYKNSDKKQNVVEERKLIKDIIAKYMGIFLSPLRIMYSNENKSLRNVVNDIDELRTIILVPNKEELLYQWIRKKISIAYNEISVSAKFRSIIKQLLKTNEADYNYYIVHVLSENNDVIKSLEIYGYGYVLRKIDAIIDWEWNSVWMLLWLYSALISKMIQDKRYEDMEQKIICNDIFYSAMKKENNSTGWGYCRNVAPIISLKLADADDVGDILNDKENAKNIVDSFKMLLFYDFDNVINNLKVHDKGATDLVNQEQKLNIPKETTEETTEETTDKKVCNIDFNKIDSESSMDNLLRNIVDYDNKWSIYWNRIHTIINKFKNGNDNKDGELPSEIKKLVKLDEFSDWKSRYKIKSIMDLLPIQSAGIMLVIQRELYLFTEKDSSINQENYQECIDIIIRNLKKAEQEYDLDNLQCENLKYSQKLEKVLDIVGIKEISPEIFKILNPTNGAEDTTM